MAQAGSGSLKAALKKIILRGRCWLLWGDAHENSKTFRGVLGRVVMVPALKAIITLFHFP